MEDEEEKAAEKSGAFWSLGGLDLGLVWVWVRKKKLGNWVFEI